MTGEAPALRQPYAYQPEGGFDVASPPQEPVEKPSPRQPYRYVPEGGFEIVPDQTGDDAKLWGTVQRAARWDPALAEEAKQLGLNLGLPAPAVIDDIKRARELWTTRKSQVLLRQSPAVRAAIRNPVDMASALDGLEGLTYTERLARRFEAGRLKAQIGFLAHRLAAGEDVEQELSAKEARLQRIDRPIGLFDVVQGFTDFAGLATETLPEIAAGTAGGAVLGAALGATSGPGALVTAGTGALRGLTLSVFNVMRRIEGGHTYRNLTREGVDPETAYWVSAGAGWLKGGLEVVGAGRLASPLGRLVPGRIAAAAAATPGRAAIKAALGGVLGEAGTEVAQELVDVAAEGALGVGEGLTLDRMTDTFAAAVASSMLVSSTTSGAAYIAERKAYIQAQQAQEVLNSLGRPNPARERNPEAYAEIVQKVGDATGLGQVFVDAEALRQIKVPPEIEARVEKAEETGSEVAIPLGEFDRLMADPEVANALREHVKATPGGKTFAEAREFEAAREELLSEATEKVAKELSERQAFAKSAQAVESTVREQFAQAVPTREARDGAALYRAFVETQAQELGMSPEEFHAQHGLRVVTEAADTGGLRARAGAGEFFPSKLLAVLHKGADLSTVVHESGHYFLTAYAQIAAQENAPQTFRDNLAALLEWAGFKGTPQEWAALPVDQQREQHEAFAYSFEKYVAEGKAPTSRLKKLFRRFRAFLRRLYESVTGQIDAAFREETGKALPALTDEVRGAMGAMLAGERAVGRSGFEPLFETREQAGMDEAAWTAYQEAIEESREDAAQELQERSLKAWRGALRGRTQEEKAQKRELREAIAKAKQDVRAEVEAMPVYRALKFLKTGEFVDQDGESIQVDGAHKMDRGAVQQIVGLPMEQRKPKRGKSLVTRIRELGGISRQSWDTTFPGERTGDLRIRGVVKAKGGLTWEEMAQSLRSEGYGPQILGGLEATDHGWFVEAMADAAFGQHVYREADYQEHGTFADEAVARGIEPEPESVRESRLAAEKEQAEEARQALRQLRGLLASPGLHPDAVGEMFGYDTGRDLVGDLVAYPTIDEMVDVVARERLTEQRGEGFDDPKKLNDAVDRATHNEARARLVAVEIQNLEKAAKPNRQLAQAAKAAAAEIIARTAVRDLRPDVFQRAVARLGREALAALKKGKSEEAARLKRQQLLQVELVRAATDARAEVDAKVKSFGRFARDDEDIAKSREVDIVAAGRAILAAHNLGPGPTQARPHLERVREADPELYESLLPIVERMERMGQQDYKALSFDDFQLLAEAVDALWDQSRETKLAQIDGKKQSVRAAVDDFLAGAAIPPARPIEPRTATPGENRGWNAASVSAAFRRAESVAVEIDGGRPGKFHRLVIAQTREAFDRYQTEKGQRVKALQEKGAALRLPPGKIKADELGGFVFGSKAQLLGFLMNAGTESGLRKAMLAFDMVRAETLDDVDVAAFDQFLARMIRDGVVTKPDLDLVKSVWDQFEELKPRTQTEHKAIYGYRMEEVEARPLSTPWGSYRGGYAPYLIDWAEARRRGARVPLEMESATIETTREMRDSLPSTGRGFTIARTGAAFPPRLNPNAYIAALDDHLRFIHMQQVGRGTLRILRDPKMREFLHRTNPHAATEVFLPWLAATLQNQVIQPSRMLPQLDWLWTSLRRNTAVAFMFGNLSNALQQITGLQATTTYVEGSFVLAATAKLGRHPKQVVDEVLAASSFMNLRLTQQLGQIVDDTPGVLAKSLGKVGEYSQTHAYFLQRLIQYPVDVITWVAARDQAVRDGKGEVEAVREADSIVRLSQGSGAAPDISKVERGTPFARMFTLFTGFWITGMNTIKSRRGWTAKMTATASLIMFAGLAGSAITRSLRGGWEDKDKDGALWDDVAGWALKEAATSGAAVAVPIAGPMLARAVTDEGRGRLQLGAPIAAIETTLRAGRLLTADEVKAQNVRDLATALTLMTGIPFTLPAKGIAYAMDDER